MARVVRAASWKVFNLEGSRQGLGMFMVFGTLVLTIALDPMKLLCVTSKGR